MKIDFDLLDELVAAGATAEVIVTLLKKQYRVGEAKRQRDSAHVAKKRERHKPVSLIVAPKVEKPKSVFVAVTNTPPAAELPLPVEKPKRGKKTRITDGWNGSQELFDYARRIGLSGAEVESEWIKFYGHHKAKGSEFVDWGQAWKNWARRSMEYFGRKARDPNKPIDDDKPKPVEMSLNQWKRVLTIYGSTNNWHDSWGPLPGQKGCRVPPELLAEAEPEFEIQEGGRDG